MNKNHQYFREAATPVLTRAIAKAVSETFHKQGKLAKAVGCTQAQLSLWKSGKAAPSLEAYIRLCRACPDLHADMMEACETFPIENA